MKFSALFLILILLVNPCFSATQSFSKDEEAVLPVTWDLSAIEDFYEAKFGFESSGQEVADITLTTDPYTAGSDFTASADVDIWWEITAPTTVTVYLLPGGALSTGSGEGISWSVSWNKENLKIDKGSDIVSISDEGSASSGSTSEITVITHSGKSASASSKGKVEKITLNTGNAFRNLPGEYKSTLTLGVEVI